MLGFRGKLRHVVPVSCVDSLDELSESCRGIQLIVVDMSS